MFKSLAEVANELRVAEIVEVEVMEGITRTVDDVVNYDTDLLGIMVIPVTTLMVQTRAARSPHLTISTLTTTSTNT